MKVYTATDGTFVRRVGGSYCILTRQSGIEVQRAALRSASEHAEFEAAMACALDDLSKIRRGRTLRPRNKPPKNPVWPMLETK